VKKAVKILVAAIGLGLFASLHAADEDILQRLDRIERLLQSQGLLDMLQQIETLQRELSALNGEIEYQNYTLEQLKKRQRDLYTDIDQRLQKLERGGVAAAGADREVPFIDTPADGTPPLQTIEPLAGEIPADAAASPRPEGSLTVEVVGDSETDGSAAGQTVPQSVSTASTEEAALDQTLAPMQTRAELDPVQIRAQYQQAFKLLKQSQYEQAIKAFREFLLVNPRSDYSDNAQYWLGEAYYVTRRFEMALEEYNALLVNYPDSSKLTHSLLKIGFCYYELGELEEATARLQALTQQYPGTTAARLAEERLKKIARGEQQAATEIN